MLKVRRHLGPDSAGEPRADRLESWKEIATHLNRDVRTLHRWELQEGLPVHRHMHRKRGSVYAFRSELDAWRASRGPRQRRSPARRLMLAVLPFVNLDGDLEQDHLSDGLTEEMLAQLGRICPDRLGVIARTSVMQYKGSFKPIVQIGAELGVDYVLEGSVRRAARRLRTTAQLIRASDQSHLWAECYDRDLGDVLLVQSEVAQAIARQIHVAVAAAAIARPVDARPVNFAVYEAYLRGRFHWYKLSREHLDLAEQYFRHALDKDPAYAAAHAGLAYVWFSRGDCGLMPPRDAFEQATAAASRALALDDTLAQVHELLGVIMLHRDWDWQGAERELQRAIALDPNYADAHFVYADIVMSVGRADEANAAMRRALDLDPFNVLFRCFSGWHLVYQARYDDAVIELERALRADPDYAATHLGLWGAFSEKRMPVDALAAARRFFELLRDRSVVEALADGRTQADYVDAMRRAAEVLERRSERVHVPAVRIARLYAHAGDAVRTMDWLERAHEQNESPLAHLKVAWDWALVRNLPRFQRLLRLLNFPDSPQIRR